ncbi:hypothetical protein [Labilibaculum antarcticum]|uniref:MotA/TolQ/ExbB proton channel domain-containing protein n=1 Tax=Labilibaculum antarcticum TaxID=1717717 RepID=A0A1Y1CKB8_9BACT|nr:hypothetical protein [Labilibaculum antarcticum]BAX80827.1 hypothetical protein ALGA_2505 [Labilibaculum antarcticum]
MGNNLEVVILIAIILLQLYALYEVIKRSHSLKYLFPSVSNLKIVNRLVSLENTADIDIEKIVKDGSEFSANTVKIDLISYAGATKCSIGFQKILNSTNLYLLKNKGNAADFRILKEVAENEIEKADSGIQTILNVPLYLGLAGTFTGIIIGVLGIGFEEVQALNGTDTMLMVSTEGIKQLLSNVGVAMGTSALGLVLTLVNNIILYRKATIKNEDGRTSYFEFLQRELLPLLSRDMADSLNTLKSSLDVFNIKFSANLDGYRDNLGLINDNLGKQKQFLDAVQEVGLVQLSNAIVSTFEKVNSASNDFDSFRGYQESLNTVVASSVGLLDNYNKTIGEFEEFNHNLNLVSSHINESSEFYNQFKKFLESHFSEVEVRRDVFTNSLEMIDGAFAKKIEEFSKHSMDEFGNYNKYWRESVDILNKDIVDVYSRLKTFLEAETQGIKQYVSLEQENLSIILQENKQFFKDFRYVEQIFQLMKSSSKENVDYHDDVREELRRISTMLGGEAGLAEVNTNLVEIRKSLERLSVTVLQ